MIENVIVNNGTGTQTINEEELHLLVDSDFSTYVTVSGGYTVSVRLDLNNLFYVNSFTGYVSDTEGVSLYGSKSSGGSWTEFSHDTVVSGVSVDAYDYYDSLRMDVYTVTGTNIYGVEAGINSSDILFGPDGQSTEYSIDKNYVDVQEVNIYNNSTSNKDYYVFLSESSSGTGLSISSSSSGTFYKYHDHSIVFPDYFSWDAGEFNNTVTSGSGQYVVLSNGYNEGYYISPVITVSNTNIYRCFWEHTSNDDGYIDFPSEEEGPYCIGIRYYNDHPGGSWSNGNLADGTDLLWSVVSGSLEFEPYSRDSALSVLYSDELVYVQFYVGLYMGNRGGSPVLASLGVEYPTTVTGISPSDYGSVFVVMDPPAVSVSGESGLDVFYSE